MYVSLELARSIALWASMVQDAGGDVVTAADRARLQTSRAGRHIGKEAIQLHGGIGVTAEYSVGHYTSRLTAIDHVLGDGDWALARLAAKRRRLRDGRPAGRPVRLSGGTTGAPSPGGGGAPSCRAETRAAGQTVQSSVSASAVSPSIARRSSSASARTWSRTGTRSSSRSWPQVSRTIGTGS